MKRLQKWAILVAILSVVLCWGCGPRPAIFRAFADSFAASWSLNLYADGTFDMYIVAGEFTGEYNLQKDTIVFQYDRQDVTHLPEAYFINRKGEVITELKKSPAGNWESTRQNHWMHITEDHLEK